MKKEKPLGMRIGESVFCAGYLLFAAIAAIIFLKREGTFYHLCGLMTLLLGGGDAFHLIPRIIVNIKGETEKSPFWLGLGNLVSSVTMTGFLPLSAQGTGSTDRKGDLFPAVDHHLHSGRHQGHPVSVPRQPLVYT